VTATHPLCCTYVASGVSASLQGLIFVVDSNDRDRIGEARDELHRMLNEVRCASSMHAARCPAIVVAAAPWVFSESWMLQQA
jgi:ADP-ribosylation factor family